MIFEPPSSEGSRGRQMLAWFVCALFLLTLVGTLLTDTLAPLEMPKLTGEEKSVFERQERAANLRDGTAAKLFERKLQLTSRVRDAVTPTYSFWLYRHLGLVRPVVLLGDQGWLFHKQRTRMVHSRADAPVVASCSLAAMERMFGAAGIRVVSVCVPRKAVTHSEALPRGVRARLELDVELSRQLVAHGVVGSDLLRVFRNNLRDLQGAERIQKLLYGITDTHWTPRAEYLTARATTRDAGLRVPKSERIGTLHQNPNGPTGRDLVLYAGLSFTEEVNRYLYSRRSESWTLADENGGPLALPPAGPESRVALFGTSFSARRSFPSFLSHFIGEPVHNAARPGGDSTEELHALLAAGHRPEVIFMEFPNHALIGPRALTHLGASYGELEIGPLPIVSGAEHHSLYKMHEDNVVRNPGFGPVVRTRMNDIVHSGDGVLAWRVQGEVFGPGVTVRTGVPPAFIELPWMRGRTEVLLPVVTAGPRAGVPPFRLRSNRNGNRLGRARIDSVELVLLASEENAIECESQGKGADDGAWYEDFTVANSESLPKHGVLTMRLQTGESRDRRFRVEVWGEEAYAPPLEFQFDEVKHGSRVYLNLNAFADRPINSIRVKGPRGSRPIQVENMRILRSGFD